MPLTALCHLYTNHCSLLLTAAAAVLTVKQLLLTFTTAVLSATAVLSDYSLLLLVDNEQLLMLTFADSGKQTNIQLKPHSF